MTLDERQRILDEFERRERDLGDFYSLHKAGNLFVRHGQERALQWAVNAAGCVPLEDKRILEVGCGRGQWFVSFECLGATRENLSGIELDAIRGGAAARRFGGADIRIGDAAAMPWPNGTFDIVFQSTVFTSILDPELRRRVAAEMLRVLRPQGTIVWYDFRYNPGNSQVVGLGRQAIKELFPGCKSRFRRATLAPPVARWLAGYSVLLATLVESLQFLNSHLIGYMQPAAR
ncbi:MAG: class I SAM-dependent methyltransferase [Pirellulales bacterium]|nr:class I SAM-dependent methyltransferase [Pirellulales bacterium]